MTGYAYTPWIWPLLASAAFQVALAGYLWRRRRTPGALALAVVIGLFSLWCLASAGELAATAVSTKESWFRFRDALLVPGMTAALWFALEYAGLERWLRRPIVAVLVAVVVAVVPLFMVGDGHLLWTNLWWDNGMRGELSPLGAVVSVYGYALALVGTGVLVLLFVRSTPHRAPVALIVLGQLGVRVIYPLGVLNIGGVPKVESMAAAVDFASLMYVVALFRLRLFDLLPVAREMILQRMPDGILVLDAQGRVADMNDAARRVLGTAAGNGGRIPRSGVLESHPALASVVSRDPGSPTTEVVLESPHGNRTVEVSGVELSDWQGRRMGRLAMLHDLTELRAAQDRLVEQERALSAAHERESLARDLHDSLGQVLGYVGLQAATIRKLLADGGQADGSRADVDGRLDRLAVVASDAQADVRRTIAQLSRPSAAGGDFLATLQGRLDSLRRAYGIDTSLAVTPSGAGECVPPETAQDLLRIVDEALTNAIRHGEASAARVSIERSRSSLCLSVEDDGRGFEPAADGGQAASGGDGHYGLRFMRERAAELGAALEIEFGAGTRDARDGSPPGGRGGDRRWGGRWRAAGQRCARAARRRRTGWGAMRILLADDNRLFVEGLTDLLEAYGHEIVATASDGLEAIARARVHRPDVVLMDIQMPRCDGLGAARAIAVERPGTRVVMLTTSDADEHLYEAIAGGAFGYLLKSMRGEELVEALGQVAEGVPPFSPGLAALLLSEFARRSARRAEVRPETGPEPAARRGPPTSADEDASDPFTPRELEVLRSVAAGRTYRETATLLDVSERTVRYHMSEMLARMHLEHRSQVIAYAAEHRLLDQPG